ncbi:MAG: TerC family protein [Pseudomonadota bacterium]|nr:TerC family protein [Pseudomonadota bacterium]
MLFSLLTMDFLSKPLWMWLGFLVLVLLLLVFDLGVLNRKDHVIGVRESLGLSLFYITLGLIFGGWVWFSLGHQKGVEYLTGFVVEKTLAMDNVFVIAMIFGYFAIPRMYQHRVLVWGILGVIVLRGIMIGLGAALINQFAWILYVFGAFLVFTGVKMMWLADRPSADIGQNPVLRLMRRLFHVTDDLHGPDFFARQPHPVTGKSLLCVTPLFLALVLIEMADVIFAVDSVPAIFAITTDPYIVYTSNIFAVLGLRALYFALAAMISRFHYLKYALAVVLVFIGGKILVADMMGWQKFPASLSLAITFAILAGGIVYSLMKTRNRPAG